MGLGAAVGIFASASSASALSFNFSFSNVEGPTSGTVTGTITGLADNTNNQTTGFTVAVTSSPISQGLGTYSYNSGRGSPGFNVSSGNITAVSWNGTLGSFNFWLGTPGVDFPDFNDTASGGTYKVVDRNATTMTFTPVATGVPFEFTPSLGFALVGLGLGASKLKQFAKKKK